MPTRPKQVIQTSSNTTFRHFSVTTSKAVMIQEPSTFTAESEFNDVAHIFVDTLEDNIKDIYKQLKFPKKMIIHESLNSQRRWSSGKKMRSAAVQQLFVTSVKNLMVKTECVITFTFLTYILVLLILIATLLQNSKNISSNFSQSIKSRQSFVPKKLKSVDSTNHK